MQDLKCQLASGTSFSRFGQSLYISVTSYLLKLHTLKAFYRTQPDLAKQIYEEMVERKVQRDGYTYSTLLSMASLTKDVEFATKILEEIELRGYPVSTPLLNAALSVYTFSSKVQEAEDTFAYFSKVGIEPDNITYSIMIQMYINTRMFKEGYAVCIQQSSST